MNPQAIKVLRDKHTTDDSPVVEMSRFQHDSPDSVFSIAIPLVAR